jgi:carbonic anhydrase
MVAAGDKPDGRLERIEAEVVRLSLANLMTFPWIAEAVGASRLVLQGYWFDVHTGVLASVGPGGFEPVD